MPFSFRAEYLSAYPKSFGHIEIISNSSKKTHKLTELYKAGFQ